MAINSFKSRHNGTNHIKDLLFGEKSVFSAPEIQLNSTKIKLIDSWPKLMGNTISKYTTYINIHNNTLFIAFSSPILKTELQMRKTKTIEKINEFLGFSFIKEISIINAK